MAGDLTGMFNQLNRAITANPLGEVGGGLMDSLSQSFGGAMGAATGRDPMSFQSQGGKELEAQKQLSQIDLTTPEGLKQAAQIYQQIGDMENAMAAVNKSKELEEAQNAKNNAILEAGNLGIQEEAKRKKGIAIMNQALLLANQRGDTEAAAGIRAGAIDGADYMKKVSEEKRRTTTLAKGAILVDEDEGIVIAENPDLSDLPGGTVKLTNPDKIAMTDAQSNWQLHSERAIQAQSTADQIKAIPAGDMKAGAYSTASEWINGVTGTRDKASQLRTQYLKVQKSGIVNAMPSGPQSDNDVRIFSRGFPPENAGKDEIVAFLEAQARIAQKAADYEEMRTEYIATGRQGQLIPDWKARMANEGKQERIQATPQPAVEALMTSKEAYAQYKDAFMTKYGWLPEPNPQWTQQ